MQLFVLHVCFMHVCINWATVTSNANALKVKNQSCGFIIINDWLMFMNKMAKLPKALCAVLFASVVVPPDAA